MTPSLTLIQAIALGGLISAEAIVSYVYSLDLYEKRDTRTSLLIAAMSAVVVFSTTGFYVSILFFLLQFALFSIQPTVASWFALFILCDLSYYLLHLLSHKVRFMWASHMLHHSSQRLNFITALRGPVVYLSFRMVFWIPMVMMGFPPTMIIVTDTLIQIYTVATHTTAIGRLGFLEYIFNTPAHHRLHHACNDEYIDKNFGGILIIWDRMFGTIVRETVPPTFGLVETRNVHNPIRLLLMEWRSISKDIRSVSGLRNKLKAIFGKPGRPFNP